MLYICYFRLPFVLPMQSQSNILPPIPRNNINYGQQPYQGLKGYLDWYTKNYENPDYQIQIPRKFFDS